MYPASFKASDCFLDMIEKYVKAGLKNFEWDRPDVEAQWEQHSKTCVTRKLTKWLTDAGALGVLMYAHVSL